jgi:hypothetical protein
MSLVSPMIVIFELSNYTTVQSNQSSLDTNGLNNLITPNPNNWWDYYGMRQVSMNDYNMLDPNYDNDDNPVTIR